VGVPGVHATGTRRFWGWKARAGAAHNPAQESDLLVSEPT
jgi:hypothetical protein